MNDEVWINFDRVLVQLNFQVERTRSTKRHVDHQINLYTAKITEEKNQIAWLEENIKKEKEELADLQKQNESSKKSCDVWKPTYEFLKKHEACLKNEITAVEQDAENESFAPAKWMELCPHAPAETLACKAVPLTSVNDWVVHIVSMRKKTQETLQLAQAAMQETIKLEKEAEELQMKTDYLKKTIKETKEDQNNSQKIEEKNQKILEKPEEFKERVFEERQHPSLPKERRQVFKALRVPCIPQKFVQPVKSFRFSKQRPETGREEKEKPVELSVATSCSSSLAENLSQKVIDTAGTNNPQTAQVPSTVSMQNQVKFRLPALPKQLTSNQQFESENAVMVSQKAKHVDEEADEQVGCLYAPQDVHTGFKPNEDNPDITEESAEPFFKAPKTPDLKGKHPLFSRTPPFDFMKNLGCEEGTSKSPAFFSALNFSQKSPGFNLFDSSLFGAQNSSDETEESFSIGNLGSVSPHKGVGSLFGKSENEDAFAFPFLSESISHEFGDGKDDAGFSFAFGQDQRSPQSPMEGFHSNTQNTKLFSLF
ncbi:protein SIX6OS1 isoform X3 [Oenanthe melanoleuca]|uniref:protein SIX6OS1 isoform X3 n=1 Tax=Oenanthe melanoleuca TaxID=2939378 RepID=UPI0024C160F9|nr:protein SIX6OS1 isoform X3 [Oenanthe melanoleuca]